MSMSMSLIDEVGSVLIARLQGNRDVAWIILARMIRILEERAARLLQAAARLMLRDAPRRMERVMVRWAETVLSARNEPVVIVNGRWRWRWRRCDYDEYARSVSLACEANVRTLPFRPRSAAPERPFAFADWSGRHQQRRIPLMTLHRHL